MEEIGTECVEWVELLKNDGIIPHKWMHSTEMEYKRKNTQDKNVSETIENIEVGIYNDDVTPAPEALSRSILDLDACATLAV